jgi:hypothetical protein
MAQALLSISEAKAKILDEYKKLPVAYADDKLRSNN